MSCPMGMNLNDDECLEVRKGMHGLHQFSHVHWKVMKFFTSQEVGFEQSKVDQCLFAKMTVNGLLMLLLCIDDLAVTGHRNHMDEFSKLARKRFKVKT